MTTQTIPMSTEAEEALLGAVIINGEIYPLVNLVTDDFYIHRHRYIWEAMTTLHQRDCAIDVVTLTDELIKHGKLDQVGGAAGLTKIINSTADTFNWKNYVKIIKDKSTRRRQLNVANVLAQSAINGGVDTASIIDMLSDAAKSEREGREIKHGVSELYDTVFERMKDPRDVWGIKTGFLDIDQKTGGLHYHQTTMISGSPGAGKTTIMLQIALNAAKAGFGVAIFEAEMDEQRVIRRMIEIITKGRVTNRMQLTGRIPEDRVDEFTQATEAIYKLPIYINDDPGISTTKIRAEVAKLKARGKWDLICMDYVNLLKDRAGDGKDNNQNAIVKAQRFREVCRYLNMAGITVQSMTKEGMKAVIPHLADMSGPAEIHYSADTVFFLVQDEKEETAYRLLPAKQRDGDSGSKPIRLIRRGLAFYDAARVETKDYAWQGQVR